MFGAPALAALLLQLAVRSEALSLPQSLGPVQDDGASLARLGRLGKSELVVLDLDGDSDSSQAGAKDEEIVEGTELKAEDGSDDNAITDTEQPSYLYGLNDSERSQMRRQLFEVTFVANLNMTKARQTGAPIGLDFCVQEDSEPPYVCRVKKYGLTEDWNAKEVSKGHKKSQILLGDEIVKVNEVNWHRNSNKFMDRIRDQFLKSRKKGVGDSFVLHIQRRSREVQKRTQAQREDRHKFLYEKEWTAQINATEFWIRRAAEEAQKKLLAEMAAKAEAERIAKEEAVRKELEEAERKAQAAKEEIKKKEQAKLLKAQATRDIVRFGWQTDYKKGAKKVWSG